MKLGRNWKEIDETNLGGGLRSEAGLGLGFEEGGGSGPACEERGTER